MVSETLTSDVETISTGHSYLANTSQMACKKPWACSMRVETTSMTAMLRLHEMHLMGLWVRGARVVMRVPVRRPSGGPLSTFMSARELSTHTGMFFSIAGNSVEGCST